MFYEIKTERLFLRPLTMGDLEAFYHIHSDEETTRYWLRERDESLEESRRCLEYLVGEWGKPLPLVYVFALELEGKLIGTVDIFLNEERTEGEMSWIIHRDYWKRGFAYEAAEAVRDFAIDRLKLKRIFATCDYRNVNSYRLMERLGMTPEDDRGERHYLKRDERVKELTYSMRVGTR